MWARQLGELAGVSIPLQAAEHYYLLTEPIAEVSRDWPVLEDPANYGYFREEGGGLMLGMFEPVCAPWQVDGIPADFSLRRAAAGLGPDGPVPGEDDVPDPDLRAGRHPQVLLRPGELHPRPRAGRRRGAGAAELLRRGRPELDRHPDRRRHRPADGALDRRRPPGHGRHRHEHRPAASLPGQPRVPGDADRRVARHGLRHPLPRPVDADGARREAVPGPPPAGRAARVLPRRQRLGRRRLVRARTSPG